MVHDRDREGVARRTLEEGRRLLAAWDTYVDKTRTLANVAQCTSSHDGLACQLVAGHRPRHRHRPLGMVGGKLPPTVEWDE